MAPAEHCRRCWPRCAQNPTERAAHRLQDLVLIEGELVPRYAVVAASALATDDSVVAAVACITANRQAQNANSVAIASSTAAIV